MVGSNDQLAMSRPIEALCLILCFIRVQCAINKQNRTNNLSSLRMQRSIFDIITQSYVSNFINLIPTFLLKEFRIHALSNRPSPREEQNILNQCSAGSHNDDANLNITQLVNKYGYSIQEHVVQTSDGYILTLYRIPRNGPPVFLMHGLLCSADDWVTAGPESGIAYLLASEGYDVWLGNARGNKHSRRHAHLSPDSTQYWDFSWDEIGRYDLPAMIDYVLQVTNQPQLKYVGHSQGTTTFFVMCSELPKYNSKVSLMVALSPVAWMSRLKSPIVRLLSPINPFLYSVTKAVGMNEFLPDNAVMRTLKTVMCGKQKLAEIFCNNILFLICGFDYDQVNVTNLPVIFGHIPAGAATKQLVHYGQGVVSGKFQRFDYGRRENIKKYGSMTPPSYPVQKVTTPVAIFYSEGDWLASVADVKFLRNQLANVVEFFKVSGDNNFNHLDFLWAKDVKRLIYKKLSELLRIIK